MIMGSAPLVSTGWLEFILALSLKHQQGLLGPVGDGSCASVMQSFGDNMYMPCLFCIISFCQQLLH